jgi:hypothetical protein
LACLSERTKDDRPREGRHVRRHPSVQGEARLDAPAEKMEAISLVSDVSGFMGYYVVYAPDNTVTISTT